MRWTGNGAHLVTVNDYLAKRDVQWMGPIYHALGLAVASIIHESSFFFDPHVKSQRRSLFDLRPVPRRDAYLADITYGTNNEFGFDYLRDNMEFARKSACSVICTTRSSTRWTTF